MKAIILSAGQGSRLLPMTETTPKCLLQVYEGVSTLSWQLSQLQSAGVKEAVVVTGFHAEKVERELEQHSLPTRTVFNPFFKVADNLGSVWMARHEFEGDCMLINGDTLFTQQVPLKLLNSAREDITLTVSRKSTYDDDDMKVVEMGGLLKEVGKKIQKNVNAESIGFTLFKRNGAAMFRSMIENSMRQQEFIQQFYLSIIGMIAAQTSVGVAEVPNDQWCETDFPVDMARARSLVASWMQDYDQKFLKVAV